MKLLKVPLAVSLSLELAIDDTIHVQVVLDIIHDSNVDA